MRNSTVDERAHTTLAERKTTCATSMGPRLPIVSATGPEIRGWIPCPIVYDVNVSDTIAVVVSKSFSTCVNAGMYIVLADVTRMAFSETTHSTCRNTRVIGVRHRRRDSFSEVDVK